MRQDETKKKPPPAPNIVKASVGPSPSFLEKMRGKRTTDINLPTPSGAKKDPRIKNMDESMFTKMRKNWDSFASLGKKK